MKAIHHTEFGDPAVLKLMEIPPPDPGPTQILVDVMACGVNRADILQRKGYYPPAPGESDILGLEIAGVVSQVGDQVEGFKVGDRVFGLVGGGGYAEKAVIDFRMAMKIPTGWDFVKAAAVPEVFYTAQETLFTVGQLLKDEWVLIHAGGSGVGSAAIQMAHRSGAKVVTTVGSSQKIERCRAIGASFAVNYKNQDFVEEIKKELHGEGVHLVLDFIGAAYFNRNLQILRHQGRLVLVGLMGGAKAEVNLAVVLSKRLKIMGSIMRSLGIAEKIAIKRRFEENHWSFLKEEILQPIVDSVFPLDKAVDAHKYMESNAHFGKIVLAVT